jgi:hypothetical protein
MGVTITVTDLFTISFGDFDTFATETYFSTALPSLEFPLPILFGCFTHTRVLDTLFLPCSLILLFYILHGTLY